jgi:hypothetical protein
VQIRIKPELVSSNNGFDIVGRATTHSAVKSKVAELQNIHCRSVRENKQNGIFVFWKEKHRATCKVEHLYTKAGIPSKKTNVTRIPTHWKYKIWFIPDVIVQLLKADGKAIKQNKDYWSIVASKK